MTRPQAASYDPFPLLVLYDAGCGFCLWALSLFLRLDRSGRLAITSIQGSRSTVLSGIPDDRVLTSWHVRRPDGEVCSAGAALVTVMRALPLLAGPGLLLGLAPGLVERCYATIAGNRAPLARLVPQAAKDRARDLVAGRALPGDDGPQLHTATAAGCGATSRTGAGCDITAPPGPAAAERPVPVSADLLLTPETDSAVPLDAQPAPAPVTGGVVTGGVATLDRELALAPAPPPVAPPADIPQPTATVPPLFAQAPPPSGAGRPASDEAGPPAPRQDEQESQDEQVGRETDLRAALRLVGMHLRPLRLKMATGLLLMVLAAGIGLGQPLATRFVLETLAQQGSLRNAVLLLTSLVVAAAAFQGGGQYLVLRSTEDVVLSSRRRLVNQLLDLSVSGMRKQKPGDLMARVTSDTALLRQIALQSLVQLVTGSVVILGATVAMILLDAVLFGVTAGVVLALGLLLGLIMPRIRRSARETQRNVGEMGNELERVLGAYTTVKAAGAEELESARVGRKLTSAHDSGVRTAMWNSLAATTSGLAVQAAFLVVLGVGGYRASNGDLSVATLIAFLLYAMQLSGPVVQLTQAISSFQAGRAALERIAEVEDMEREAHPLAPETPESPLLPGSLAALGPVSWERATELVQVSFRYPDQDDLAVRGVDLTVPERGVTAIVGPSGSGKSSVLKLLEGFYPLESGTIRVAGRSLAEWDLGELRRHVAYVEQETPVFAGTVRDNITYGLDDVDDAAVMAVLEQAGLEHRICSVEEADGEVGHRGSALSGGERQRVAIARALLRSPRLLLMDEATSQLDAASEARVRDLIGRIGEERAVVLVAHRLSTVVQADQIVVMQDGRVRARGRHDELMASDELYRGLVEEQQSLVGDSALALAGSA